MTDISDGDTNNFLFFYNDTPHEPMLLQEPEYIPAAHVNNKEYDTANKDRFTLDGKTLNITTEKQMMHYQTNMATLLQVGQWLDYLRENDVYDNTRIIIVSDHGYYLYQSDILIHKEGNYRNIDISNYFPLMMVKDFGSTGFSVCDDFMTNADVPTIATEGIIENPINPFTGNPINSDEKTAHDQFIMTSRDWSVDSNNGNRYSATKWAIVTNNIWDRDDWEFIDSKKVLTEHKIP
jgi:phosphoglycerol transferase MdoB-like AlkP superfamily enzyme